ncbi:2-C-methyl-D-erythritol 4-phosphate cytidylyltransferase [Flavobacteriales bacterium]|nr:2-C-methyl-D-erythritol 4-phosphate cytidylyltransferase [Flavobacteriales bacterium]
MRKYALIVAGGVGKRLNSHTPKQFLILGDKPILMHTLNKFSHLDRIYLVLPKKYFNDWKELCEKYNFDLEHVLVEGGDNRFCSVKNGLNAINSADIVLIHDGARPFVKKELITTLTNKVSSGFGIIPVIHATDSIRIIEGDSSRVVNRDTIYHVQTPQCFIFNEIFNSYNIDYNSSFTDDASVFESKNRKIKNVIGNYNNIKITTPLDLELAQVLIKK